MLNASTFDDLQRVLVFDRDHRRRALAHFRLGDMALRQERRDSAIQHFREALVLDARMESARVRLNDLNADRIALHESKWTRVWGWIKR
jgi:predicted negative regulator of RcsB-dependent stress response